MATERDLQEEMRSPKYAHIERERRWLVASGDHPPLDRPSSVAIEDLYIAGTRMRLRVMRRDDGWTSRKLTKKYETEAADARPIVTAYLNEGEYALLAGLPRRMIRKRRYAVPAANGRSFSLDLFEPPLEGLKVLEIEAEDAEGLASIPPPCWAGPEITHQPEWQGAALSQLDRLPEISWPVS
jgi:CYTH domain-containing protein